MSQEHPAPLYGLSCKHEAHPLGQAIQLAGRANPGGVPCTLAQKCYLINPNGELSAV